MIRNIHSNIRAGFGLILCAGIVHAASAENLAGYQLSYEEQEPGVDVYATQYLVTDRYLRINNPGDDDGFILYDDELKTIYSISNSNRSTLVMKLADYKKLALDTLVDTQYQALAGAPAISGMPIYQYRVSAKARVAEVQGAEVCTDIQLAAGLLPQVTKILYNYQQVVASSQVNNLHKMPEEFQTTCVIADQVYNTGDYYLKGLPVLEWHTNDRKRALVDYKKIELSAETFVNPEGYREFTLDDR
jgi:hypothetical protein